MMKTVYILIGVSGSGKSAFAAEYKNKYPKTIVISSDQIRKELWGDESDQQHQDVVWDHVYYAVAAAIKDGEGDIILDATNLSREHRKSFISYIHDRGAAAAAIVFTTELEVCIERDAARERTVGEKVIKKQLKNFDTVSSYEGFEHIYEWGEEGWTIIV